MAEPREKIGAESPFGKRVEVRALPNEWNPDGPAEIMALVDGEPIPYQRRVVVDSGMNETTIEVELLHLPTGGTVVIEGYLIGKSEYEDYRRLLEEEQEAVRRALGNGN